MKKTILAILFTINLNAGVFVGAGIGLGGNGAKISNDGNKNSLSDYSLATSFMAGYVLNSNIVGFRTFLGFDHTKFNASEVNLTGIGSLNSSNFALNSMTYSLNADLIFNLVNAKVGENLSIIKPTNITMGIYVGAGAGLNTLVGKFQEQKINKNNFIYYATAGFRGTLDSQSFEAGFKIPFQTLEILNTQTQKVDFKQTLIFNFIYTYEF